MWLLAFATGIAYWIAAVVSLLLTRGMDGIAAVWPPSGILLGALLIAPKPTWARILFICAFASFTANLQAGNALVQALGFTIANVTEPLVAILAFRLRSESASPFVEWRGVARFTGGVVSAAFISTLIASVFVLNASIDFAMSWFTTDVLGMLVVCPALVMLQRTIGDTVHLGRDILALFGFTAVTMGVFAQATYPLLFVPYGALLLLTWCSGARGATGGVLVVAAIGSVATTLDRGPLSLIHATTNVEAIMLQIYLMTLFASSLPIAALREQRRHALDQLRTSERSHRLLAEASSDIIVRFGLDGTPLYVSPACRAILGYDSAQLMARGSTLDIHPDDLAGVVTAWRAVALKGGEQTSIYRQRSRDGGTVWLEAAYRRVPGASGEGYEIVGSARDVTRRVAAELVARNAAVELEAANRFLADAEAVAHLGHWRVDLSSGAIFWSEEVAAMHELAGHQPRALDEMLSYFHKEDRDQVAAVFEDAVTGRALFRFEARIVTATGLIRHVSCRGQQQTDGSGRICGLFGTLQDVSEWIALGQTLDRARLAAEEAAASAIAIAETDTLTGIASRRRVLAALDLQLAVDTPNNGKLAVIVADVDHFKRVNDQFGHPRGDAVLRDIAATLQSGLRHGDLVGRLGGEEFLLICRVKDRDEAQTLADRLRQSIATSRPGDLSVTASFGIATRSRLETAAQLIEVADRALYQAKRGGRNSVRLAA